MTTATLAPYRIVLPASADRAEWLAARLDGVTASEIPAILGISPFESAYNLHFVKSGLIPGDFDDDRLSLGRHMEPWIAERFAATHPEFAVSLAGLYASAARPWQMATPDRLIREFGQGLDPVALLELKTSATYDGWGEDGTDDIPAYIRAQVLWQLDVLGLDEAQVCCLFLSTTEIRTYTVTYDVADVDLMRLAAKRFLFNVARGNVPPVDGHRATLAALKALHPDLEDREAVVPLYLARRYRAAKASVKAAEARAKFAEQQLRQRMGSARAAVDTTGTKVATRLIYDRKGYEVRPTRIDSLTPAKTVKEAA